MPTKLLTSSEAATIMVSPDGVSIIFSQVKSGQQVIMPSKDWPEVREYLDERLKTKE
jgi:hypothetical protein